jgi:hypothetical protein
MTVYRISMSLIFFHISAQQPMKAMTFWRYYCGHIAVVLCCQGGEDVLISSQSSL